MEWGDNVRCSLAIYTRLQPTEAGTEDIGDRRPMLWLSFGSTYVGTVHLTSGNVKKAKAEITKARAFMEDRVSKGKCTDYFIVGDFNIHAPEMYIWMRDVAGWPTGCLHSCGMSTHSSGHELDYCISNRTSGVQVHYVPVDESDHDIVEFDV